MAFKLKGKSPLTKALVGNQHKLPDHLKQKILDSSETSPKKLKEKGDEMASALNLSKEDKVRRKKGGTTASVTNRLNKGNVKGAKLARRTAVASSKGKKAKAKRLQRKVDDQDSKFFKDQVKRRREK